jgi:hypothetical protein
MGRPLSSTAAEETTTAEGSRNPSIASIVHRPPATSARTTPAGAPPAVATSAAPGSLPRTLQMRARPRRRAAARVMPQPLRTGRRAGHCPRPPGQGSPSIRYHILSPPHRCHEPSQQRHVNSHPRGRGGDHQPTGRVDRRRAIAPAHRASAAGGQRPLFRHCDERNGRRREHAGSARRLQFPPFPLITHASGAAASGEGRWGAATAARVASKVSNGDSGERPLHHRSPAVRPSERPKNHCTKARRRRARRGTPAVGFLKKDYAVRVPTCLFQGRGPLGRGTARVASWSGPPNLGNAVVLPKNSVPSRGLNPGPQVRLTHVVNQWAIRATLLLLLLL